MTLKLPAPNMTIGSKWEHSSGRVYEIVMFTNLCTLDNIKYPVTVVYKNIKNDLVWSRSLADWHRSFKVATRWIS